MDIKSRWILSLEDLYVPTRMRCDPSIAKSPTSDKDFASEVVRYIQFTSDRRD